MIDDLNKELLIQLILRGSYSEIDSLYGMSKYELWEIYVKVNNKSERSLSEL